MNTLLDLHNEASGTDYSINEFLVFNAIQDFFGEFDNDGRGFLTFRYIQRECKSINQSDVMLALNSLINKGHVVEEISDGHPTVYRFPRANVGGGYC